MKLTKSKVQCKPFTLIIQCKMYNFLCLAGHLRSNLDLLASVTQNIFKDSFSLLMQEVMFMLIQYEHESCKTK